MPSKSEWEKTLEDRKAEYKDLQLWKKIVAAKYGYEKDDPRLHAAFIQVARTNQDTILQNVRLSMTVVKVPFRTGRVDAAWDKDAIHYQVKVWIGENQKQAFVFEYSQGSLVRHWPTIREILFSFLMDALLGAESFADYCLNTGAERDSRKAHSLYEYYTDVLEWFELNRISQHKLRTMYSQLQAADEAGDINADLAPPVTTDIDGEEIPF